MQIKILDLQTVHGHDHSPGSVLPYLKIHRFRTALWSRCFSHFLFFFPFIIRAVVDIVAKEEPTSTIKSLLVLVGDVKR